MFNRRERRGEERRGEERSGSTVRFNKTEEIALRYFSTTVQLTSDYKYNQQTNATKIQICKKTGRAKIQFKINKYQSRNEGTKNGFD